MTSALRIFPFPVRRMIVGFLMNRHQFSAAVTLLGTIWPQANYENPSANTCLTSTGGLRISEVHGVGYKLLSNTPLLLIVYSFRRRLNLVLHATGTLFTRKESEEFMGIMMNNFMNYAQTYQYPGWPLAEETGDRNSVQRQRKWELKRDVVKGEVGMLRSKME